MEQDTIKRADEIRAFILNQVDGHESDIANLTAGQFGITRQAVHLHLKALEKDGALVSEGRTRGKVYRRSATEVELPTDGLTEDDVYLKHVKPVLVDLPANVLSICEYGVTEMVNNVIDHSGSDTVRLVIHATADEIYVSVIDMGVGIFRKIRSECDLDDVKLAVFELTKGKLTTDPDRHTGEGIFFTSRMFDHFSISSYELYLGHKRDGNDWLFNDPEEDNPHNLGTIVTMRIHPASTHTTDEVFSRYATSQDDYAFNKTHILVELAKAGEESFVSRSQAKRIVARLDTFKEVVLDFVNVDEVGPAFADEIFRVWASQHLDTALVPINMVEQVTKMWRRALSQKADSADPA